MPNTRRKVIKTVYKDEVSDEETGDFSDSGSDAQISEAPSSDDEEIEENISSPDKFSSKPKKTRQKHTVKRKPKFAKEFIQKLTRQIDAETEENECDVNLPLFSVKDLTETDKLLPSVLNLSESDSSDDETPKLRKKKAPVIPITIPEENNSENEADGEYTDVWESNIPDNSSEIASKTFLELEKHKSTIEETKASLQSYQPRTSTEQTQESNVTDLLALGEDVIPQKSPAKKKRNGKKVKDDSDSEVEDWEEVKESKPIPQQGLQLIVELPDSVCRKSKKVDVEMMMKRKMNRVKKEHQVFMHKVHVLCWIGHGNYISPVLNDEEIMAAVLSMVPKGCYPDSRLNMKYVEQITEWFKDKLTLKHDKYVNKFRPKAPPLKNILLDQIKNRTVSAKKYMVFIFVAMLRALGLQCRVMFNFVTVPLKPPSSELCSLSTKQRDSKSDADAKKPEGSKAPKRKASSNNTKTKSNINIPQVDGIIDSLSSSHSEFENVTDIDDSDVDTCIRDSVIENIMQLDGNDDAVPANTLPVRSTRAKQAARTMSNLEKEGKDPPKKSKKGAEPAAKPKSKPTRKVQPSKSPQRNSNNDKAEEAKCNVEKEEEDVSPPKKIKQSLEPATKSKAIPTRKAEPSKSFQENFNHDNAEEANGNVEKEDEDVSPPKKFKKSPEPATKSKAICTRKSEPSKSSQGNSKDDKGETASNKLKIKTTNTTVDLKSSKSLTLKKPEVKSSHKIKKGILSNKLASPCKTRSNSKTTPESTDSNDPYKTQSELDINTKLTIPKIVFNNAGLSTTATKHLEGADKIEQIEKETHLSRKVSRNKNREKDIASKYFEEQIKNLPTRKRSRTTVANETHNSEVNGKPKIRAKSASSITEKSIYFDESKNVTKKPKLNKQQQKKQEKLEDSQRVSHKDLVKPKAKPKNDVTGDLVNIIKDRIKEAKEDSKKGILKGKVKEESDDDSDYLPVENPKGRTSDSDEDFKPTKLSPKGPKLNPGVKPTSNKKKLDRRVLSSDDEALKPKVDVWCEIFLEELEQWIAVDVVNGKVHCTGHLYSHASHPVCYIIGWDNNNYLKDLTRRYVPQWNTVTRKQRAEPDWWRTAVQPWLGPRNARDREEDEALDVMQLEAPLPKSISEYKNHPLYALKRHLLKFEAIYPPDAQTLGFVRNEAVYARECVYVCRSRDTWLKEAKVVKMGEKPYKVVKARPKWDKLSNKLITDKPLEVFGPWQVQDYEPPTAENGRVPRNAYGNVELFKECMLPKGTVHVKLPGLNKVARKLNIDCAPAMTGFDFNGGWSHPVYDGFVVCQEYEEIITEAWLKDQEEQERKELEKIELRVYGNWKRLIKGLLIRERLKYKYGFEKPSTSQPAKNKKGPRYVAKKS